MRRRSRRPADQHGIMIMDSMSDLFSELEWRGLVYDSTEGLRDVLARQHADAVRGFDRYRVEPSHRHLLPVLGLARPSVAGHKPIALVGGGTGLIGDPSGKSTERTLLTLDEVRANVRRRSRSADAFSRLRVSGERRDCSKTTADWLNSITAMEFLRDVGKYFTVNQMIAKESVKRRMESDGGISYTEFSYSLVAVLRLPRSARSLRMHIADRWQRSMGQHRCRLRPDPPPPQRTDARVGDAAHHDGELGRNSGKRKPARCGSIPSGRRLSASISSG